MEKEKKTILKKFKKLVSTLDDFLKIDEYEVKIRKKLHNLSFHYGYELIFWELMSVIDEDKLKKYIAVIVQDFGLNVKENTEIQDLINSLGLSIVREELIQQINKKELDEYLDILKNEHELNLD